MKKLILILGLFMSMMTSCVAQHPTVTLERGHAIIKVIEVTEGKAVASSTSKNLILNNAQVLVAEKEYNVVYEIIETRGKTLLVNLIGAETSDKQNAADRGKLLRLLNPKK